MSYKHFTPKQRTEIAVLLRAGHKQKDIAEILGKNPSSVSRELQRNSNANGKYQVSIAKYKTKERRIKANQRFRKIENDSELEQYIIGRLKKYWSPEQIAGRLKKVFGKTVTCHETIYNFVYQKRPELKKYLRSQKGKYRRRCGTKIREKQREESKKRRIDTRPQIVEEKIRLGDWEGDLIFGKERNQAIMTHNDRVSVFLMADKLNTALAKDVKEKATNRFKRLPEDKKHTLTYDNDTRLSEHEMIEREGNVTIYFAHPYSAWERGGNENGNGLLRQFFPKKSSFAKITQKDVDGAVKLLNQRPRKKLGYLTPEEVFKKKLRFGLESRVC